MFAFFYSKRFCISSRLLLIIVIISAFSVISCERLPVGYDGSYLERKLALPYILQASLSQGNEKYDVEIKGNEDFTIKFLSGDVTEGLTVEFFDNGVFLFFEDLRFKTNSDMFTNLESLKNAFSILSQPFVEKTVENSEPVNGIDIVEISASSENINVIAYLNKKDGSLIRMQTNMGDNTNNDNIIIDVKKFENTVIPTTQSTTLPSQESVSSREEDNGF